MASRDEFLERMRKGREAAAAKKKAEPKRRADAPPKVEDAREPASKLPHPPSLKNQIGLSVGFANQMLLMTPWTAAECLDQVEAEILIDGLDQAQMVSPTLRKYLKVTAAGGGWLGLAAAVVMIAMPRLTRHNLIPWMRPEDAPRRTPAEVAEALALLDAQRSATANAVAADEAAAAPPPPPYERGPVLVPPLWTDGATPGQGQGVNGWR